MGDLGGVGIGWFLPCIKRFPAWGYSQRHQREREREREVKEKERGQSIYWLE
jgi:hypothetical protein